MDPPVASPAQSSSQRRSPSSLPGRDPTADADTSLIRKRPRLSQEQETPPAGNGDLSNQVTLSDAQSSSAPSPALIDIPQLQTDDPPGVSIIMPDEDTLDLGRIDAFPFRTSSDMTPETAAQEIAAQFHHKTKDVPEDVLCTLYRWLDEHLRDTEGSFQVALQDHECTNIPDVYHLYSDHWVFWNHVVSCFMGLTGQSSVGDPTQFRASYAFDFFDKLLTAFLDLGERLLKTEVAILDQASTRRDSTRPVDSPKHSLMFTTWVQTFNALAFNERNFLKRAATNHQFNGSSIRKNAILRFQHCAMDCLITLINHIAVKPELVELPFSAVQAYLNLCRGVINNKGDSESTLLQALNAKLASLFKLVRTMNLELLPKIRSDDLHPSIHIEVGYFLTETLRTLLFSEQLTRYSLFDLIMKEFAECQIDPESLIAPSPKDENPASAINTCGDGVKQNLVMEILNATTFACQLESAHVLMLSQTVDLRIQGVEYLGKLAIEIWQKESQALKDYTSKFLLRKGIVSLLFGPQSHAALISKSYGSVGFLFINRSMPMIEADALWCTFSKYQQSDISQHTGQLLLNLQNIMNSAHIMYFCNKYRGMSSSAFNKQAENLFRTLLFQLRGHPETSSAYLFEAASICISLLKNVSMPGSAPDVQESQLSSLREMFQHLPMPHDDQEMLQLIDLCTEPIRSHHDAATGCVLALCRITGAQNEPSSFVEAVLSRLSFDQCAQELINFIQSTKDSGTELISIALLCRIDLTLWLLSVSQSDTTSVMERMVWESLFGKDAISSDARELAWKSLASSINNMSTGLSGFYERCVSQYLPTLSPDLVVSSTYELFAIEDRARASDSQALLPIESELIRFAVTCPSTTVSNFFITQLLGHLFGKKALNNPDVAFQKQVSFVKGCIKEMDADTSYKQRAANLLRYALSSSTCFEEDLSAAKEATEAEVAGLPPATSGPDQIRIPIRVHKGNAEPQTQFVTVNESANCSELAAAISSETELEAYALISSGQKINIAREPQQPIRDLGIRDGNTLIVQKCNTLQSVEQDASRSSGKTAVERELLQHLDVLYKALDEPSCVGEYIFDVLTALKFPGNIRALVISLETPFGDIFPPSKPWRMRLSLEVLYSQLQEQIAVGVADEKFLVRGVHLLISLLDREECTQDLPVVRRAADVLLALLRERPVKDEPEVYFKDALRFTNRTFKTLSTILAEVDGVNGQAQAVHHLYLCVLEGVLLSASMRAAFVKAEDVIAVHRSLLMTTNNYIQLNIPTNIRNAIRDSRMRVLPVDAVKGPFMLTCISSRSSDIKSFFWSMFMNDLIPAAQEQPKLCTNVYSLAPELLLTNVDPISQEQYLRTLVRHFSSMLLNMEHLEILGNDFDDHRVPGLLELLRCCVGMLKMLKKPLELGNLASKLFSRLLFPFRRQKEENAPRPVINVAVRKRIYDLLIDMCESLPVLTELTTLCGETLRDASFPFGMTFPGPENFVRAASGYAGLENLAQTCYMNSLVQQLFMNVHFRKFILDTPIVDPTQQAVLEEFKNAFAEMQSSHIPAYCPEKLAAALDVDVTIQDDAHIFFTTLIGKLEDSMPDDESKRILKSFFGGVNKSQTIGSCTHVSESHDEYFNLSLVVKDKASLAESLDEYTQGATLEGGDKFKCTKCGSDVEGHYVDAVRRTALDHIPDNLALGLKRFRYETYDGGTKVNDYFDFPEYIDMSKYKLQRLAGVDQQDDPDMFQLVGVVVHSGTLQFGHYWSYAAERGYSGPGPLPWYRLEDSVVTRSSIEEVMQETRGGPVDAPASFQRDQSPVLRADNAYVLFYQRVSSVKDAANCLDSNVPNAASNHPRVPLPQDMAGEIAQFNDKYVHWLHLFAIDHINFVRSLAARLGELKEENPAEKQTAQSSVVEVIYNYWSDLVSRTPFADQFEYVSQALQELACSKPPYAKWILGQIFSKESGRADYLLFHKKSTVRRVTNRLVLACLTYLRESDPQLYGIDEDSVTDDENPVSQIAGMLGRLTTWLADDKMVWAEFFGLVGRVAEFGLCETETILDAGLLKYCLEVILLRTDSGLQSKHMTLWNNMATNNRKYPMHFLVDCIYSLLHKYVDMHAGPSHAGVMRITDSNKLMLTFKEMNMLKSQYSTGGNCFLEICFREVASPRSDGPYTDWGICKLAVLLTDPRETPDEILDGVNCCLRSLLPLSPNAYPEAVASCLTARRMDGAAETDILECMAFVTEQVGTQNEIDCINTNLWVMKTVYVSRPELMLPYVARLCKFGLNCGHKYVEQETKDWLVDEVLVAKPYTIADMSLRQQRIEAVKDLTKDLGHMFGVAVEQERNLRVHDAALRAFKGCVEFLEQAVDEVKRDVEMWQDTEEAQGEIEWVRELSTEMAACEEVLTECAEWMQMIRKWSAETSNWLVLRQNKEKESDAEEETDGDVAEASEEDDFPDETDEMSP